MAAPRRGSAERALGELLRDPRPLYHRREPEKPISLLFVHLDTLFLTRNFADVRFQVRLRYGGNGVYQEKYTQKVRCTCLSPERELIQQGAVVQFHGLVNAGDVNGQVGICETWDPQRLRWNVRLSNGEVKAAQVQNLRSLGEAVAGLGAVLLFRCDPELPPVITLDLLKLGFFDTVISQAAVTIPFRNGAVGAAQQDLVFSEKEDMGCCISSKKQRTPEARAVLGHLGMTLEVCMFSADELEQAFSPQADVARLVTMLDMLREQPGFPPGPRTEGPVCPPADFPGERIPIVAGRPVAGTGWSSTDLPYR